MKDITRLIINNNNIHPNLKDKIIECVNLIISNYPQAYRNLYKNLENINIQYKNNQNKEILESIEASSIYITETNTVILDERMCNGLRYKNLIIHELLHVSSYHDEILGLKNIDSGTSISLNEGLTELLTRTILNDMSYGIISYENDINNVFAFNLIVGKNVLINSYFNGSIVDVLGCYINKLGSNNNLREILYNMDYEHIERVRNFDYDSKYKDKYIKLLINDISKINVNSNEEVIAIISFINSFIRGQYNTKTVPINIKLSIEDSINSIFSKYNFNEVRSCERKY